MQNNVCQLVLWIHGSNIVTNINQLHCQRWNVSSNFWIWLAKARRKFEHESTLLPHQRTNTAKYDQRDRKLQHGSGNNRFRPYDSGKREIKKSTNDSFGFGPPTRCVMNGCNQTHYLGQCQLFARLTFADQLDVVREHQLCRCCCHMAAICKRTGCANCPGDKIRHHFRLCTKTLQPKSNAPATSVTPYKANDNYYG